MVAKVSAQKETVSAYVGEYSTTARRRYALCRTTVTNTLAPLLCRRYLASAMKKLDAREVELAAEREARQTEVEAERAKVAQLGGELEGVRVSLSNTKSRLDRAMAREAAATKAKLELAQTLKSTTSAVRSHLCGVAACGVRGGQTRLT